METLYFRRGFWVGLLERAIKTAAQAALAFLTTAGAGVLDWDWTALASITAAAVVFSVLTSLADPSRTWQPGDMPPSGDTPPGPAPTGRHVRKESA